ncbi:MAG: hypothetical protein WC619_02045 [Patescibacteria group bacterium]
MRSFISILVLAVILALTAFGCAGRMQYKSNVHSGNVPEWVVPASLSPAIEKDGEIIAVGFAGRMYDTAKQKKEAAQIAASKIQKHSGPAAAFTITGLFTDRDGNIFVVAKKNK